MSLQVTVKGLEGDRFHVRALVLRAPIHYVPLLPQGRTRVKKQGRIGEVFVVPVTAGARELTNVFINLSPLPPQPPSPRTAATTAVTVSSVESSSPNSSAEEYGAGGRRARGGGQSDIVDDVWASLAHAYRSPCIFITTPSPPPVAASQTEGGAHKRLCVVSATRSPAVGLNSCEWRSSLFRPGGMYGGGGGRGLLGEGGGGDLSGAGWCMCLGGWAWSMHACSAHSSHLFHLCGGNEGNGHGGTGGGGEVGKGGGVQKLHKKMCFFSVVYEGNSDTFGLEVEGGAGEEWMVDVEVEVCSEGDLAPPEFARGIDLFHDIFKHVNAFQLSYDDVDQVCVANVLLMCC